MYNFFSVSLVYLYIYASADKEEVKKKLEEILSSEEFSEESSKNTDLLAELRGRISEYIAELFDKLNVPGNTDVLFYGNSISAGMMLFIKIAAVVLLIAVIALIAYFIFRGLRNSIKFKKDEDSILLNTIKDPDVLMEKVAQLRNAGDFDQALRFLYIALLVKFNNLNLIKINKSKTNKQYLMEIYTSKPEIHGSVADFTNDFNVHWYGRKKVEKEKFDFWFEKYDSLIKGEV